MISKSTTPSLPEMGDFTLQGSTVGVPGVDLHAPTYVAVVKDGEIPIVKVDVLGITTRSDQVIHADHPQGNNELRKKKRVADQVCKE